MFISLEATLAAMRSPRVIVLLGAAYALSGCGATAGQEVQAKLQQFAHAIAARNAVELCQQILAPSLVKRLDSAGLTCRQAMTTFVDGVQDPTLSVSRVSVTDNHAEAVVLTGARGQRAALESIGLVQTGGGWRLESLATPH